MKQIELDTLSNVRKGGMFIYVRMVDSTVRFVSFDGTFIPNHSSMVEEGEVPFSAGAVSVDGKTKTVRIAQPDSYSLGIKSAWDDVVWIEFFLWKKKKKKPKRRRKSVAP